MKNELEHYVYVYCDPTITGIYAYPDIELTLENEPFYVGKGKGSRDTQHVKEVHRKSNKGKNWYRYRRVKKLLEQGKEPIILRIAEHLNENQALALEMKAIATIGRKMFKQGPLLNKTSGGEGESGENHPFNRVYKITSPSGDVYTRKGYLRRFCATHNLDHPAMRDNVNAGPIRYATNRLTAEQKLTVGWSIERLLEDNDDRR